MDILWTSAAFMQRANGRGGGPVGDRPNGRRGTRVGLDPGDWPWTSGRMSPRKGNGSRCSGRPPGTRRPRSQLNDLGAELRTIDGELAALAAYENARATRPRQGVAPCARPTRRRVPRQGAGAAGVSRQAEILSAIAAFRSDGVGPGGIINALNVRRNKSAEQSVSNALAALKKSGSRGAPGREVHRGGVTVDRRVTARRFGQSAQSHRYAPTPPASPPGGRRLTPGISANPTHRSTMRVTLPPPARRHPRDAGSAAKARHRSRRTRGPGTFRVLASRPPPLDPPLPSARVSRHDRSPVARMQCLVDRQDSRRTLARTYPTYWAVTDGRPCRVRAHPVVSQHANAATYGSSPSANSLPSPVRAPKLTNSQPRAFRVRAHARGTVSRVRTSRKLPGYDEAVDGVAAVQPDARHGGVHLPARRDVRPHAYLSEPAAVAVIVAVGSN